METLISVIGSLLQLSLKFDTYYNNENILPDVGKQTDNPFD